MSDSSPAPTTEAADPVFLSEVLEGLGRLQKRLPSKYFYDAEGSRLFDAITELDAYYPTRIERAILRQNVDAIAERIGPEAVLIEYGSGSSDKTRLLLERLSDLAAYVPIDISEEHLHDAAERLRTRYPNLHIAPVAADYTRPFTIPDDPVQRRKRVVFFPGSTVGNFEPEEAAEFFRHVAEVVGPGGGLLLGVDRKKDAATLEQAYDDPEGVTAAFNLNLLHRLNRELGADFDLDRWHHRALYNAEKGRVEMHLVSEGEQSVRVDGETILFADDETIHTENSYKYAPGEIEVLAAQAGLGTVDAWEDPDGLFGLLYFEVRVG